MTDDPLFLVAAIACLAVLVILMIGIGGFAKGGEFNRSTPTGSCVTASSRRRWRWL